MSQIETTETIAPETTEAAAEAAWAAGDPDGPTVRIRAAWRDLSCKMSGPEAFRRVLYPGRTATEWPDADRLPGRGERASERRCVERCDVPVGTIVQTHSRDVYHGSKGRCSRSYAIVGVNEKGKAEMIDLTHRVLRSRPVDEVRLPSGALVFVDRPER